jgi:hypothetical protein
LWLASISATTASSSPPTISATRIASLASFTASGVFSATTFAAGIDPAADFVFGTGVDLPGLVAAGLSIRSKIGPIKLGGATVPTTVKTAFASRPRTFERNRIAQPDKPEDWNASATERL